MKLWGGRFSKPMDEEVKIFSSSLSMDQRMWKVDITASLAHVQMLMEQKIVPIAEAQKIQSGLQELAQEILEQKVQFNPSAEDIHSEIERLLTDKIGPVASKMHTARSRNDQVATDLRLFLSVEVEHLVEELKNLQKTIVEVAGQHLETLLPGMTHLQHAQPVSLAHHLLAYFWMLQRDVERLTESQKRIRVLPLGSAALAGTTFPLDRQLVCDQLKFEKCSENSMDAVSDRDFVIEFLSHGSILAMHFSRWCEEWILWSTPEFQFVELDDTVTTGSSIMPQKKNPDMAELIRGRSGRLFGSLIGVLTLTKGLPLAYNRDLQEDKYHLFTAMESLLASTRIMNMMLKTAKFNSGKMLESLTGDFSNATDVADHLAKNGMPFREAHEITGVIVRNCIAQKKNLEDMTLADFQKFHSLFTASVVEEVQHLNVMKKRGTLGGTAPSAVQQQILSAQKLVL